MNRRGFFAAMAGAIGAMLVPKQTAGATLPKGFQVKLYNGYSRTRPAAALGKPLSYTKRLILRGRLTALRAQKITLEPAGREWITPHESRLVYGKDYVIHMNL